MQKAMSFNDISIVSVKGNDYRVLFWYMSKNKAINSLKKYEIDGKEWSFIKHKNLLSHIRDE